MDALKPSDLGQVVCVHEGWTLVLDEDATPTPATKALADLMQAVFPLAVERVNAEFPNTPLNGAVVLLAHKGYAEDWDVHDAVGFQAVASEVQTDEPGVTDWNVSELNLALVVLVALVDNLDIGDDADLASAVTTLGHEMAHVAEWMVASGGQTPLEVFDRQPPGSHQIARVQRKADSLDHVAQNKFSAWGAAEDRAETLGSNIVDDWLAKNGTKSAAWQACLDAIESPTRARKMTP